MTPQEYCRDKAAASGSSFSLAFRFLPAPRRAAITAFYAYCREVDDVVDECRDANVARMKLAWWQGEIERMYAGVPTHPVTRALRPGVDEYAIPRELLEEILVGMAMDLDTDRYADFSQLRLYCHRVAGVVGEVAARIFGHTQRATLEYAERLGLAFQLTNIIRDVGEDARRGRIYLPQDELARFGVNEADILAGRDSDAFRTLMADQRERAEATYDDALARLPAADRKAQRPGLVMAAIYRATLRRIAASGYPVLHRRVRLARPVKYGVALAAWLKG